MKQLIVVLLLTCGCFAQGYKSTTPTTPIPPDGVAWSTIDWQPINFSFSNGTDTLVTIEVKTGKVKFGKNYDPDVVADHFWKYLGESSPSALRKRIAELEEELKESRLHNLSCRESKR